MHFKMSSAKWILFCLGLSVSFAHIFAKFIITAWLFLCPRNSFITLIVVIWRQNYLKCSKGVTQNVLKGRSYRAKQWRKSACIKAADCHLYMAHAYNTTTSEARHMSRSDQTMNPWWSRHISHLRASYGVFILHTLGKIWSRDTMDPFY